MEVKKLQWSDIPKGERVKCVVGKIIAGELSLRGADLAAKYKASLSIIIICEDYVSKHPFTDDVYVMRSLIKQKNHHSVTNSFVRSFKELICDTFDFRVTDELLSDALIITPLAAVEEYNSRLTGAVRGLISEMKQRERQLKVDTEKHELEEHYKSIIDDYDATSIFQTDFMKKAKAKFGDKYKYTHIPNDVSDCVVAVCKEHGEFTQRADIFLRGHGCPDCIGVMHLSVEERADRFIQLSKQRYGDLFDYSMMLYVDKNTPVLLRCKKHNATFHILPDTHLRRSSGCPYCNDSTGQIEVRMALERYRVPYVTEYRLPNDNPNCRRSHLRADFWLEKHNTIIEFHGEQHFEDIDHFYKEKDWTFQDQQIRDQTLRDYCTKNGINLIEIRYDEISKIDSIIEALAKPLGQ